jgi:uncharacterized protein YndB with AHSA1/START domain
MALTSYTIVRRFAVSPERLFRAFAEPDTLARWVWGAKAKDVRARTEPRPGGTLEVSLRASSPWKGSDRMGFRGVYAEVVPGRRIVHTVHWDADVGYNHDGADVADEVVVVDVEPEGAGARLSYAHHGIPDDGRSAAAHEGSVRETLDDLDRLLSS